MLKKNANGFLKRLSPICMSEYSWHATGLIYHGEQETGELYADMIKCDVMPMSVDRRLNN